MKLKKHYIFLLAFIFGIGLFQAEAQYRKNRVTGSKFKPRKRKKPRNYINSIKGEFAIGFSTYYGDLCGGRECFSPQPATSIGIAYRLNESLSLRGSVTWLRLTGTDADSDVIGRKKRNLHFRSENLEFVVMGVYDIFAYQKMYRRRQTFSPYLFLGIGGTYFNPRTFIEDANGNKTWYSLSQYTTEGTDYSNFSLVVPYGIGIRIKATPHLDFDVEIGMRWANTDYLDDVSDKYANQSQLSDIGKMLSDRSYESGLLNPSQQNIDRSFSKRGNPESNDAYFMTQVRASYTLQVTKQSYNINSNVSRMRIIKSIKRK